MNKSTVTYIPYNEHGYDYDRRRESSNVNRSKTFVVDRVRVSMVSSDSLLLSVHVGYVIPDHKEHVSESRQMDCGL